MSWISRFEDIQAWKEALKLVRMIYQLTNSGTFADEQARRTKALIGGFKHSLKK